MVNAYVNLNKPIVPDNPWWLPIPETRTFYIDGSADFACLIRYSRTSDNETTQFYSNNQSSKGYPDAEFRILVTEDDVFKVLSKKVNFRNYEDVNRCFQLDN